MTDAAFDSVAGGYDAAFTHTETGIRQRRQVRAYLATLLDRPLRILELNCGTGADALWLAELGHEVLATDLSMGMVEVAAQKAAQQPGMEVAQADIHAALAGAKGSYDLIFSNFGGFNCLSPDELAALQPLLTEALVPGGHFVGVVMPRFCAWETVYFLAKLRPRAAFRRWTRKAVPARLSPTEVQPTWYYNPRHLRKAFGSGLELQARCPIGSFLPPSYLDPFFAKRPRFLDRMDRWEQKVAGWSWLSAASDHYLVDFIRTTSSK